MLLDPRNPPDPESTTLHLLVSQVDCASGSGAKLTRACVPRTVNGTGQTRSRSNSPPRSAGARSSTGFFCSRGPCFLCGAAEIDPPKPPRFLIETRKQQS